MYSINLAIGPKVLLWYMSESNASGDAFGRREPSTSDLLWLSPLQQINEEIFDLTMQR